MLVRLSDKGQVTIPKQVRDELGLRTGDELEFVADGNGGYRVRKVLRTNPFAQYRGRLAWLAGHTPDQMVESLRGDVK